jgi:outer membrane autotransporter protein
MKGCVSSVRVARLTGAVMAALAGIPAQAQTWNMYQNPAANSFFIPFVTGPKTPDVQAHDTLRYVNLTLHWGDSTKTTPFVMDTGSTGIAASDEFFRPRRNVDTFMGNGQITYTSSNLIEAGEIYLTNVVIHGRDRDGQAATVTAQVPILRVLTECPTSNPDCGHKPGESIAYMGIGFNRGGVQGLSSAGVNNNPLLALLPGQRAVESWRAGYIINNSGTDRGIRIGLTAENTAGFSTFIKLPASTSGVPANTPGCSAPTPSCFYDWGATTAQVSVNGRNVGTGNVLPDSGIVYMIIDTPSAHLLPGGGPCPPKGGATHCLPEGVNVRVSLPGLGDGTLYAFQLGDKSNPATPAEVAIFGSSTMSVNTGVGFYGVFDYLYDPVAGYVGYRFNGAAGSVGSAMPVLALQGATSFDSGFLTDFPVLLLPGTTTLGMPTAGMGVFQSSLFGEGALAVDSGNYWLLGLANSYSGGTTINGGSLNLGPGATLPFGSTLTLNGGTFNLNGNSQVLSTLNGSGGTLALGNGMLVLNTTTANTLSSSLTGNGMFVLQGGGSLNLLGSSGSFSGSTVVSNASLAVNGLLGGNLFVGSGGTVSGSGSIGGNLFNSGVMAPGNSIGTLTVSGNFTNTAGTYLTEVVGAGQSDRLNVGGTATLNGGTVVVSALPGMSFAPSTTYTIVNAAGGLSGTFASVNELYPFLLSDLSYDANNAYLNLAIGGFAAAAATPTQIAVGNVLDANVNNATGDFATVLGAMAFNTFSNTQAQATLQAISGNNYAGFSTSMVQGAQLFMNNFANQTGGGGSPMSNRVALAEACDVACDATTPPKWGAWGGALGGLGTIGANQPVGSVTYNAGGFAAGLDRSITDSFRMGVTAGYTTGTQWVSGFDGLGRTDTFQVGLYGGFAQDKVYADGLIGYAYSWNQMWRNIPIPGLPLRTAQGRTGASQWYGQLETGYRFDLGTNANAFITPFARLQAYTGTQNGFTETGAQSLNLTVAQQTTNSLRSVIGAQLGGSMDLGWREKLAMQLRLGWSHEYADVGRPVTATLAGAPAMPFTTFGVTPQRDGVVLGLSANTAIAEATSVYLRYEGDISAQDSAHAITAGVRMTW